MTTSKALKSEQSDKMTKRKASSETAVQPNKKRQINQSKSQLSTKSDTQAANRHADIIKDLSAKYTVIPVNVISSSKIQQRVSSVKESIASSTAEKPTVVLLHSRTKEVCKVITIVELCKRLCSKEAVALYQYNEMFELAQYQVKPSRREKIDETVLAKRDASDDSDDDFEVMQQSRILDAVLPPPPARKTKSLRVFLSTQPISELKARPSITVQQHGQ